MSASPLAMPKSKSTLTAKPVLYAELAPESEAKTVRPGTRPVVVESLHDGVVKAKHLKPGQRVRAWLHDAPRGGERVVATVERINAGARVHVTFSSAHDPVTYKAAYRFYDESLVGTPVQRTNMVPALVAYEEV